ncbi:hypothetical protein B0F90DRAFT_1695184 [Multifurca ochricompacta]|uniref:Uncharacterized protein n=1 Tax=Multifurca ochricompacta TaxID=376703 RepID=A0AAD4MBE7_9AGAM|nr:hypothetical protein B0F90DRAFT_1695184 [Multifurca ochricompacta]
MSFRPRRATMRPAREFDAVLRARDQQVSAFQEQNKFLAAQLETSERRLTNARANAHADARAFQLQERKIEQLRMKLRDVRSGSAAQRRELEDVKRESEIQKMQLMEAQEESLRHLARLAELEEALQGRWPRVATNDVEHPESDELSQDHILDTLLQVTIDLEAIAEIPESPSSEQPSESASWSPLIDKVEMGTQTPSDEHLDATRFRNRDWDLQDAEDMERLVLQLRNASELDQRQIRDLEVDLEHGRRLIGELRIAVAEEQRLARDLTISSARAQSRVVSLEDAAGQNQQVITALEVTVDKYQSEINGLRAQIVLLRALLDESRAFNDDLEESYNSIMQCKDAFIQDLQEKVEDFAASEAWSQQREAVLHDAQERLATADIEILELRLELESAQQNAVTSTNRIIHLEADVSATRNRLRATDAENGDLRDELGMTIERSYALEDELHDTRGWLDDAESTIHQLHQKLEQCANALAEFPNGSSIRDEIQDVNDVDSASDEGSIDTLVMDFDEHLHLRLPSGIKDVGVPAVPHKEKQLARDLAPVSVCALELRLEAMALKFEVADAARICRDDVENILGAKLEAPPKGNPCLDARFPTTPISVDKRADSPLEIQYSLPTITEDDELVALPALRPPSRVQTCGAMAGRVSGRGYESEAESVESPSLPSPTLSDIWFSNIMVSLALSGEMGGSVLDWDLPSPGGDSDG